MNKYLKLIPMALLASAALTVTSCSDDDDDAPFTTCPGVDKVFTEGLPASFDGATFTTNADGQVTAINDGYKTYTFEYGTFSRATTFNVLMKCHENSRESSSGTDYYMQLGKQGFVTYILEVNCDDEKDTEEWRFEYNSDGQMTRMQRTEGGDDFKMTYAGGDITKVVYDEEDGDHREYTMAYTNKTNTTATANKGCIMLFDEAFHIQIDEMEVAYYAGLLGRATKNLPMGATMTGVEGGDKYTSDYTFCWEFNADKLPVKFWEEGEEWETTTFTWK